MATRFDSLKGEEQPANRFGAFARDGDKKEGAGSGAFGARRDDRPFARRGGGDERPQQGVDAPSGQREGGAFGDRRRNDGPNDRDGRQDRGSNAAFATIGKDRNDRPERAPRDGPADAGRQGNFGAFGGNKRDGNREEEVARTEESGNRRTFPPFAARGSGAPSSERAAGEEQGPRAQVETRFSKFVADEKLVQPPAEQRPVVDEVARTRFSRPVDESSSEARSDNVRSFPRPDGASEGRVENARSWAGGEGPSSAAPAPAATAASIVAGGLKFTPKPFAVKGGPAAGGEEAGAFSGMRRAGEGGERGAQREREQGGTGDYRGREQRGEGGGFRGGRESREAPAAFQGMRRAGQDREGGDREGGGAFAGGRREGNFGAFAGQRPRDGDMRDRAREDNTANSEVQTMQTRYQVKITNLIEKETPATRTTASKEPVPGSTAAGSHNMNPGTAAAAAAASGASLPPAQAAALAKAARMGDDGTGDLVRGTFARHAQSRLEDFLTDLSKDAAKKAAGDLAKLAAVSKGVLAAYSATLLVRLCLSNESASERRSLGSLLGALRTAPSKKEAALCTDEELAAALEAAASGLEGEELEPRVRLFNALDALTSGKGGLPVTVLFPACQALLQEKPRLQPAHSETNGEYVDEPVDGNTSWGDAAVGAPPKAAPAPAVPDVDHQADADAAAEALLATGMLGAELLAKASEEFVGFKGVEAAAALMTACLKVSQGKNWVNSKNAWLGKDKFRPLLSAFCHGKTKASVAALFRLQAFFNDTGFPLGDKNVAILLRVFQGLYEDDVVEEEPMQEWRNEMRNTSPGHDTALMQLEEFFEWLDNADEEDEEEEEEEELSGIARPNNRGMLR